MGPTSEASVATTLGRTASAISPQLMGMCLRTARTAIYAWKGIARNRLNATAFNPKKAAMPTMTAETGHATRARWNRSLTAPIAISTGKFSSKVKEKRSASDMIRTIGTASPHCGPSRMWTIGWASTAIEASAGHCTPVM